MIIDNKSNNNIYPEIELNNYKSTTDILTKVNLGIGFNLNDSNNRIFIKKNNNLFGTFITILNNNQFNNDDIGKKIIYKDSNIQSDEIKSLINNKQAFITINNSNQEVSEFNYKKAFISRNNDSYLKTTTESNLILGTNNNNLVNINKNGKIGINNNNPQSNFDLTNNYGLLENLRQEQNKTYLDSKTILLNNNNFIILCKTFLNNKYSIEGFLYNNNKKLIKTSLIFTSDYDLSFNIDNLKNNNDNIIICYNYLEIYYYTESKIFSNEFEDLNLKYTFKHNYLDKLSYPIVKSFTLSSFNGYMNH